MDKAKKYVEEHKEQFLNELFELLRIPSISAQSEHKPDMRRCAEWLAASLKRSGADRAEVMETAGNPVVYAEKRVSDAAPTVLVYGHYDVMPVDPREEWNTEPFEPVIRDGRIWGRGADDDKGQLFMHAKAFEAMCATGTLPCNVKFMLEVRRRLVRQASTPSASSTASCSRPTSFWSRTPRCSRWIRHRLPAACAVWPTWRSR